MTSNKLKPLFQLKLLLLCAILVSGLFSVTHANAHESHDTRLEALEKQLEQVSPDFPENSVELMLHRADLHRRQRDWDAALHDYQHVAQKEPDSTAMMLGRVQLHLDQQHYSQAIFWASRVLRKQPAHTLAELQYARALAGAGDNDAASIAFERAINRLDKPRPEHFIEQAQLLLENTSKSDSQSRAVAALDQGADTLGHPVSLHRAAFEIERNSGQDVAALIRIDKLLAQNGSLLNWRLQRAELLIELGRQSDALDELYCLTHKLQQLPDQRRLSDAFQELLQRSQSLLIPLRSKNADAASSGNTASASEC